jgi:hypothetical protein
MRWLDDGEHWVAQDFKRDHVSVTQDAVQNSEGSQPSRLRPWASAAPVSSESVRVCDQYCHEAFGSLCSGQHTVS